MHALAHIFPTLVYRRSRRRRLAFRETVLFFDSKTAIAANGSSDKDFTVHFSPPLQLDSATDYKISLVRADFWNSWHNVTAANNNYEVRFGSTQYLGAITPGAYNITELNTAIRAGIAPAGLGSADDFELRANNSTLHSEIVLKNGMQFFMNINNSLAALLGFNKKNLTANGTHVSDNKVDITQVQSLLFHCSLVSQSSLNGVSSDVTFSYPPDKGPGYLLSAAPNQIINVPITRTSLFTQVQMQVTDQSGALIHFNGERVTYFLRLRAIRA